MRNIIIPNLDWTGLRQELAWALYRQESVRIEGGTEYLASNPGLRLVFDDCASVIAAVNAGTLRIESDDVAYQPAPLRPARYELRLGPFSSIIEVALLLAPALFRGAFRSELIITGVTHSPWSCPPGAINETLFSFLEDAGFYANLSLRRFGFYGSGNGCIETKIYPAEKIINNIFHSRLYPGFRFGSVTAIGGRIYFSRMGKAFAEAEKTSLCSQLGLDPASLAIIDVHDADGYGNTVQIHAEADDRRLVFARTLPIYDHQGLAIYEPERTDEMLAELVAEVRSCIEHRMMPEQLRRELIFFGEIVNDN